MGGKREKEARRRKKEIGREKLNYGGVVYHWYNLKNFLFTL